MSGKDDDSYGEDDFEQLDSCGGSNKFSPKKAGGKASKAIVSHDEKEEEEFSGDLEKYIMEMKVNTAPMNGNEEAFETTASLLRSESLEGIKPSEENSLHKQLSEKLGYNERPLTHVMEEPHKLSTLQNDLAKHTFNRSPQLSDGPHSMDSRNEAEKVGMLLMELFPEKYSKKKPSKGKKLHHLEHHPWTPTGENDNSKLPKQSNDVLSSVEGQLKLLKRELQLKDDKIMKLTEHSTMMANHMDRLKGEITKLQGRLKEAELEIEEKDGRIASLIKNRKKRKTPVKSSPVAHPNFANLETEVLRLREREQALMEAVEELSSQNEDLIIKLRESMQRELELSSKRAAFVNSNVMNLAANTNSLPNIHDSRHHAENIRTQSEPSSSEASLKRVKKKGKGH